MRWLIGFLRAWREQQRILTGPLYPDPEVEVEVRLMTGLDI